MITCFCPHPLKGGTCCPLPRLLVNTLNNSIAAQLEKIKSVVFYNYCQR